MEVLKFIAVAFGVCLIIFCGVVFSFGAIFDLIESIKLAKLKKKWAAEQERAKISRDIKLDCCKKCLYRANGINYFGYPCIYNLEWLCEGPPAPEEPIIKVEASEDWVKVTRCKNCVHLENKYCSNLKINVANPDWFCCAGMKKKGDK